MKASSYSFEEVKISCTDGQEQTMSHRRRCALREDDEDEEEEAGVHREVLRAASSSSSICAARRSRARRSFARACRSVLCLEDGGRETGMWNMGDVDRSVWDGGSDRRDTTGEVGMMETGEPSDLGRRGGLRAVMMGVTAGEWVG